MKYFCTLFDRNYLIKGLTMIMSLIENNQAEVEIYVLCMDEETKQTLKKINMQSVHLVDLAVIEGFIPKLREVKKIRTAAEYCWTLSSSFPLYLFDHIQYIELLTYLDADLYFYEDTQAIFDEMNAASVSIIEHRFSDEFIKYEVNGKFCVEWVSFRRNAEGLACLNKWHQQCVEWCYARQEGGKFGDQKYLDEWPDLYPTCHIIQNLGAGVAPWNYKKYAIDYIDGENKIKIDGFPLIFYHFHQFKIFKNNKYIRMPRVYESQKNILYEIYKLYEKGVEESLTRIKKFNPNFNHGVMDGYHKTLIKGYFLEKFS